MNKVDLSTLKKNLPRGSRSKIARTIGITPQAVSYALSKENPNPDHPAIVEAVRLLEASRKRIKKINQKINS